MSKEITFYIEEDEGDTQWITSTEEALQLITIINRLKRSTDGNIKKIEIKKPTLENENFRMQVSEIMIDIKDLAKLGITPGFCTDFYSKEEAKGLK